MHPCSWPIFWFFCLLLDVAPRFQNMFKKSHAVSKIFNAGKIIGFEEPDTVKFGRPIQYLPCAILCSVHVTDRDGPGG